MSEIKSVAWMYQRPNTNGTWTPALCWVPPLGNVHMVEPLIKTSDLQPDSIHAAIDALVRWRDENDEDLRVTSAWTKCTHHIAHLRALLEVAKK